MSAPSPDTAPPRAGAGVPVPFWRYIFFVVPATSPRPWSVRSLPRGLVHHDRRASCWLILGAILAGSISYFPTWSPDLL